MIFSPYISLASSSSADCATGNTIKSLLAYTYGLEDCDIDVEVSAGEVTLTGRAPCDAAAAMAVGIAADFTSKPVNNSIAIVVTAMPV